MHLQLTPPRMNQRVPRIFLLWLLVWAVAGIVVAPTHAADLIRTLDDPDALQREIDRNEHLMLIVGAPWCAPCTKYKADIEAADFDVWPVFYANGDLDPWSDFVTSHKLKGYPATIFFWQGKEVETSPGRRINMGPIALDKLERVLANLREYGTALAPAKRQNQQQQKQNKLTRIGELSGHEKWVYDLSMDPVRGLLASASRDQRIGLWDINKRKTIGFLEGHTGAVFSVDFHPDGLWLASGGADRSVRVWKMPGGQIKTIFKHPDNVAVRDVMFSPDGRWLAISSDHADVLVLNTANWSDVRRFKGGLVGNRQIDFSPDSQHLAAGGKDGGIRIWSTNTGERVRLLTGHENWVRAVSFSPDGERLYSAGRDYSTRVWNWRQSEGELLPLKAKRCFRTVIIGGGSQRLGITSSYDGSVNVFDTGTNKVIEQLVFDLKKREGVARIAVDWSRSLLVTAHNNGKIYLWSIPDYPLEPLPQISPDKLAAPTIASTEDSNAMIVRQPNPLKIEVLVEKELDLGGVTIRLKRLPDGEVDYKSRSSKTSKLVSVKGLWMAETEFTERQYQAVMGHTASFSLNQGPEFPLAYIKGPQLRKLLAAIREKTGLPLRPPSEAEWIYAASTDANLRYPEGSKPVAMLSYGWFNNNSELRPHQVGQKLPNRWGLHDLFGNMREICFEGEDAASSKGWYTLCGGGWNISATHSDSRFMRYFSTSRDPRQGYDDDPWAGIRLVYVE